MKEIIYENNKQYIRSQKDQQQVKNQKQCKTEHFQNIPPPPTQRISQQSQYPYLSYHIKPEDYIKKLTNLYSKQQSKRKNIENLCYMGLGKKLITCKSNDNPVQINKVNFYIRDYLLSNVQAHVEQLQKINPNIAYLIPQCKGVSYVPQKIPKLIQKYISREQFQKNVTSINKIIQNSFYLYKTQSSLKIPNKVPRFLFILFFIMVILLVLPIFKINNIITIIITAIFLGFTFISIMIMAIKAYSQQKDSYCITEQIVKELNQYVKQLNNAKQNRLEWKIGQNFFWIQIHVKYSNQINSQSEQECQNKKQNFQVLNTNINNRKN